MPPGAPLHGGKLAGELYCNSYAELYGVESTIVRFGIPYGPRARPAAVIPSFIARARAGEPLSIAGAASNSVRSSTSRTSPRASWRHSPPAAAGRTYNLAGSETVTIRGLAELVQAEVAPVEIVHTEGRAGDLQGATIRSDRAERELGWRATTPLREGVRRYAEWLETDTPPDAAPATRRRALGTGPPGRAASPAASRPPR